MSDEDEITESGWYYYDTEYTDEGSCGPFDTQGMAHAAGIAAELDPEHLGVIYIKPVWYKPIESEHEHEAMLREVERLITLDPAANSGDGRRLYVLALIVEDYEHKKFPIPRPQAVSEREGEGG